MKGVSAGVLVELFGRKVIVLHRRMKVKFKGGCGWCTCYCAVKEFAESFCHKTAK